MLFGSVFSRTTSLNRQERKWPTSEIRSTGGPSRSSTPCSATASGCRFEKTCEPVVASDPQAVAAIIGNVAADIAATLPSNDPWRPGTNGASIITGTLSDQTDLIPPSLDEGTDPELASVAEGIESAVADLVRTAFVGGTELAESLLDAWPDHEEIVRRATDAVRWLLFRRRAYKGPTDLFVVECASAWATFMLCDAQRQHDLAEERETRVVEETISDLAYNLSERFASSTGTSRCTTLPTILYDAEDAVLRAYAAAQGELASALR